MTCDCGVRIIESSVLCENCCEHDYDEDEGYTCLSCGKEGAEEVLSAAYDRDKDWGKYGE